MPAIPYIIMAGAQIGGSVIASRGNTKAAKTAAEASDKAAELEAQTADKTLAQAKEIYQQQRADQGPFRESGYSSLNALNYGLGLPAVSYQAPASAAASTTPTNFPRSTLDGVTFPGAPQIPQGTKEAVTRAASTGSQGTAANLAKNTLERINTAQQLVNQKYGGEGQTTKVKGPNGVIYLVPNDKVSAATAAGGTVVV